MPFTLTMPKLSPTMEEGMIAKWHKKPGEFVEAGEVLMEVATDKATVEYNTIDEGWLRKIIVNEGAEAKVNQPIAVFTEQQNESIENYQPVGEVTAPSPEQEAPTPPKKPVQATKPAAPAPAATPEAPKGRVLASPLAKKLAQERSLDLSSLKGSGPGNRVMSRDLEQARPAAKRGGGARLQPQNPPGAFTEETMTPMRKVISLRLQESKSTVPHFYVQKSIDAQPLWSLREQLQKLEMKVSVNDCVVKACALALRDHPVVNSGFNAEKNTLIRFQTIDVAVAVSVGGGLITPIVRYADYKSVFELSDEIKDLAKRAKEGKLEANEYQGGSFTVSNLGMYEVTDFQAIINPPQAAILAVSSILEVPIVKNGMVVPGKVMNITLSVDHRVIDGVAAAEFLKTLQKQLENPVSLLLPD